MVGHRLPAPVHPLVKVWRLGADAGVIAVAWHDDGVGGEGGEEPAVDRLDDRVEVTTLEGRGPRSARKEGVA